jgi:hypothetical protein
MPFTGLSTFDQFTASGGSLIEEDVSPTIKLLSIRETPVLDWLGDGDFVAKNVVHEFVEEELRPNYLTTAGAINSATAATGIQLSGLGDTLTVGTLLENESVAPEVMQVTSVVGANSVLVSRNFGSSGVGSLASGGRLFVRAPLALEGQDAVGDVTRSRRRKQTYVKFLQLPITVSLTQAAVKGIGIDDEYSHQKMLRLAEALRDLEKEVIRGRASGNSIGSESVYRSFNGLRAQVGSISSVLGVGSFSANPHLYLGNAWQSAYDNGLRANETIALLCGQSTFRDISNLNDTKVQDSNQSEVFQRRIRKYSGPFGDATVILSPWMPAQGVIGIAKERVKVGPLQGRSFRHIPLAMTGSAQKGAIEGEYTVEIHHPQAMFQITAT